MPRVDRQQIVDPIRKVNAFNRGARGQTWFYRGYMCFRKQQDRAIRCMYKIQGCNLWMPREFAWQNTSQQDCMHYIDLLAAKKLIEAKEIEKSGLVIDTLFDNLSPSPADRPFVTVTATRLLAMLRGEEVLEIPIDAKIRFKPDAKHYTVDDVDAAIFAPALTEAYISQIRKMVGEGTPIFAVGMPGERAMLDKYGFSMRDDKMHSGMNLSIALENAGLKSPAYPFKNEPAKPSSGPSEETEVSSEDHKTHTETITLITRLNQTPYFVRRLLRDGYLLWSGTSFAPTGPWTQYSSDPARLTALGIRPHEQDASRRPRQQPSARADRRQVLVARDSSGIRDVDAHEEAGQG